MIEWRRNKQALAPRLSRGPISASFHKVGSSMKRVFYEWGAIATVAFSLICFGYSAVSIFTPLADFETFLPLGRWKSMQILGSAGAITINDHRGSREEIEFLW